MPIERIDLSEYLETRRRMRLLPNLLDVGIAYSLFRPVANLPGNLRPFATAGGESVVGWVRTMATERPAAFLAGALGYLGYALVASAVGGLLALKLKNLVLSDSRAAIWTILAGSVLAALALFSASAAHGVPVALAAVLPLIYGYACVRYLEQLGRLARQSRLGPLVGVARRSFAYSTARYGFLSRKALSILQASLRASGALLAAYLAIGLYLLALLLVSGAVGLDQWLDALPGGLAPIVWVALVILAAQPVGYARRFVANAWLAWTRSLRTHLAHGVREISRRDPRAPILFLRSFRDDQLEISAERFWGHAFLGLGNHRVRLEEVLAETLYAFGPLVALSNPGDALPPLGAARENVADEHWQGQILSYMAQAAWIVLVVGATPSLRWEVDRILERGYEPKTLVVFPPSARAPRAAGRLLAGALPALAERLALARDEAGRELEGVTVLAWHDRAAAFVVCQDGDADARGYADAVRLAVAMRGRAIGDHALAA